MDPQNTITFHAEIPQSEIINENNLFLWDNFGSPFDDFFIYQPPPVQSEEVPDESASKSLQLLSSPSWDFSLPDLGYNLNLSSTKATGIATGDHVKNEFHNAPMSVLQNHPSFHSVPVAGSMSGCIVNKNHIGNTHLQPRMLHQSGEQGINGKLNDYHLWKLHQHGNDRKVLEPDQYKWMNKVNCSKRHSDKKSKQLAVLTKENEAIKHENILYIEEIKRLQTMERNIDNELRSQSK